MSAMTRILIEDSIRVRKLLGPAGVGVAGTTKTRAVGIMGSTAALGSSGMSMTTRQEQHTD